MTIAGMVYENGTQVELAEKRVALVLFHKNGFRAAWGGMGNTPGEYEFYLIPPGEYIFCAVSAKSRLFRREIVLQENMTLDIQLEPLHPPESITVGQPPEPTPSRLVRCLKCGGTAPLEWLKSRRQEQIHIPDWAQAQVLEGSKRTVEWMHVHHTAPDSYWPTEIIPRPKDFKKEAAEEMYEALEHIIARLDHSGYDKTVGDNVVYAARVALRKARGESPDAK